MMNIQGYGNEARIFTFLTTAAALTALYMEMEIVEMEVEYKSNAFAFASLSTQYYEVHEEGIISILFVIIYPSCMHPRSFCVDLCIAQQ